MYGLMIQSLRKKQKMSQKELGDRVGIGVSTISMWESELREPSLSHLVSMAELFDVSTDYILGRKEENRNITKEETEFLDLFDQLPEDYKSEIKGIMKGVILSSARKK